MVATWCRWLVVMFVESIDRAFSENSFSQESISGLVSRLKKQKNIDVKFETILNANHFYKNKEKELSLLISSYLKDKVAIL